VIRRSHDGESTIFEPVEAQLLNLTSQDDPSKVREALLEAESSQSTVLASSGDLLFLLENPLGEGDHFLFGNSSSTTEEEMLSENGDEASMERSGEDTLTNLLYENNLNSGLEHALSRSINSPCIFYWKGTLNALTFSTDGLFRIVSGPNASSSDFSELFAGEQISDLFFFCFRSFSSSFRCGAQLDPRQNRHYRHRQNAAASHANADKPGKHSAKKTGLSFFTFFFQASGVPDLYCVSKQGSDTKYIVSVKRFYIHDDRIDRYI
jgi:hypothetical protein